MGHRSIQLSEFCRLFKIGDRPVRYLLERGYVPKGVPVAPSTGNHRQFGPGHAFWLAIAVMLKIHGLRSDLAAEIADRGVKYIQQITQNLNWDRGFLPTKGYFVTDRTYYLEVGDSQCMRLITNAKPVGQWEELDWLPVRPNRICQNFAPVVTIRIDLSRIAAVLRTVDGWDARPPR